MIGTRQALVSTMVYVLTSIVGAQPSASPLKGVTKVTAYVTLLTKGAAPGTLTEGRLQTLTELKLRTAGLRVLSKAEDRQDPDANPSVEVSVSAIRTTTHSGTSVGYVFSTRVAVREYWRSPRNGALVPSELWSNAYLNTVETDQAGSEVERTVTELLEEFINAWLKANPRR